MRLTAESLLIDTGSVEKRIENFLRTRLAESGRRGVVFGLSGGLDSSTVAALCAKTFHSDDILSLVMPHRESDPQDMEHASSVAEKFKIPCKVIDITSAADAIKASCPETSSTGDTDVDREFRLGIIAGNIKARIRMNNVYMVANATNRLVVGSGDKSEFLIGYFTKFGDGAADILPIADLYKTQVRQLARHLGVPEEIVAKPSSPGFWKGQTAEREIGMNYQQLDLILYGLERFMKSEEIAGQLKIPVDAVKRVEGMIGSAEHKRRGGIVFKLGYRTPTLDWRIPL